MTDLHSEGNAAATVATAVSYRGLIRRVARKLNKSESLVSMVNSGKAKSQKVSAALAEERIQMLREQNGIA